MYDLLKQIVGEKNFSQDEFEMWCYARDSGSIKPRRPEAVVMIRSVETLVEVMKLANGHGKRVIARGASSSMCGAPNPVEKDTLMLDLTTLQGVDINEDTMIATVLAGVTFSQLNTELAKKGWELGLEGPWSAPTATIGGSLAVHAISMGAAEFGSLGSQIVGLEVVLPDGTLLKTGSGANPANAMVMRDCNGADLTGLFLGAHGTLGIVTKAAFKIYPIRRFCGYGAYAFTTLEQAIEAAYNLAKQALVYDSRLFVAPVPPEIDGPIGLVFMIKAASQSWAETHTAAADTICTTAGGRGIRGFGQNYYEGRNDARVKAFGKAGPGWLEVAGFVPIRRYPDAARPILEYFRQKDELLKKHNIKWSLGGLLETRSMNVPMALFCNESNTEAWDVMLAVWGELGDIMFAQGVSPYWIGYLKDSVMWRLGPTYELYKDIKHAIDPKNILNPGML